MNAYQSAGPQLGWGDLVWSHFSRSRFDPLPERIEAAGRAGFGGIGLYAHAFGRWLEEGHSAAELRDHLQAAGIVIGEIEAMRGWWAESGPEAEEARQFEAWASEIASTLGARYLQVIGPIGVPVELAAQRFGQLCDRMSTWDVKVGIEWLPFTNIATPHDAQRIVQLADRPNGGYCADIWHHIRGTGQLADVLALEPEKIFSIQLSDGPIMPADSDYKRDCLANRLPPGEGEFECAQFVAALASHGVQAPLSAEVCSPKMWNAPVDDAARWCAESLRMVLNTDAR